MESVPSFEVARQLQHRDLSFQNPAVYQSESSAPLSRQVSSNTYDIIGITMDNLQVRQSSSTLNMITIPFTSLFFMNGTPAQPQDVRLGNQVTRQGDRWIIGEGGAGFQPPQEDRIEEEELKFPIPDQFIPRLLSDLCQIPGFSSFQLGHAQDLQYKFSSFCLPYSPDARDPLSLFITQVFLLEATPNLHPKCLSKVHTLCDREYPTRTPPMTIIDPNFFSENRSLLSYMKGKIPRKLHSSDVDWQKTAETFDLQITVLTINRYDKIQKEKYALQETTGTRRHHTFILNYNGFTLLIPTILESLLKALPSLGSEFVLDSILYAPSVNPPDILPAVKAKDSLNQIETALTIEMKPAFGFAFQLVEKMDNLLESGSTAMRICRDTDLAKALSELQPHLSRLISSGTDVKESVDELENLTIALSSNTLAYHFLVSCSYCHNDQMYANLTFPECGHPYCEGCFQQLCENSVVNAAGELVQELVCWCGQKQTITVFQQDAKAFAKLVETAARTEDFCVLCRCIRPRVFFIEQKKQCCKKAICLYCFLRDEHIQEQCPFCRSEIKEKVTALMEREERCGKCQEAKLALGSFNIESCPHSHILCPHCQYIACKDKKCPFCADPYSLSQLALLQKQLQDMCVSCKKNQPFSNMLNQRSCEHNICYSCVIAGQDPTCKECTVPFDAATMNGPEFNKMWSSRCIQCNQLTEVLSETLTRKLHCGHHIHEHCVRIFIESALNAPQYTVICCPLCDAEVDQSLLLQQLEIPKINEYFWFRGLMRRITCRNCGSNSDITASFDFPKQWQCSKCRQSQCTACDRQWDNYHEKKLCWFAQNFKEIKRIENTEVSDNQKKKPIQCPRCLNVQRIDKDALVPVRCSFCTGNFITCCSVQNELIRNHGPSYHRPDCQLYQEPGSGSVDARCGDCNQQDQACPRPASLIRKCQFSLAEGPQG